jgi:hypothetical protein
MVYFLHFLFVSGDRHDGDQHQRQQTMRANHAVYDPIFIQYIIMMSIGITNNYWVKK